MQKSKQKKKILMILSKPFVIDPRVYQEAESLVNAGHNLTVIFWDRKKAYKSENKIKNIRVIGLQNNGVVDALHSDIFRNPFWWRNAYYKGLELYRTDFKFDVVHCHDLDTLYAGVWLKKKLGITLVYDAHEIFGYMIDRYLPWIIPSFTLKLEKRLLKKVDYIITVNQPLKDYFSGISDKPVEIVMNCKKLVSKKYISVKNKVFTICYFGVFNSTRYFPNIVYILGSIKDIKFIVAGKNETLFDAVKKRCENYKNIEFLGTISLDDVIKYTLKSDAVLCMIKPEDKNAKIAHANKQFEAMVCGRALITTKDTYIGEMTKHLNCGVITDFNERGVIDAVTTLRDNPKLCTKLGKNALNAAVKKYNWDKQEKKLLDIYENLM
jgi:glycosyltransferase involved in cell wall biosynthesis